MKYEKPDMEMINLKFIEIVTASVGGPDDDVDGVDGSGGF